MYMNTCIFKKKAFKHRLNVIYAKQDAYHQIGIKGKLTNKNIVSNLHRIVMHLSPANPARRLNHAALANDGTPPDADARGRHVLARLRGRAARRMEIAAKLHVSHDDGAAAERNVCGACDGAAARDLVARVLFGDSFVRDMTFCFHWVVIMAIANF